MFVVIEINQEIQENAVDWWKTCHSFMTIVNLLNYCSLISPFEMESKISDWILVYYNNVLVLELTNRRHNDG